MHILSVYLNVYIIFVHICIFFLLGHVCVFLLILLVYYVCIKCSYMSKSVCLSFHLFSVTGDTNSNMEPEGISGVMVTVLRNEHNNLI